MQILSLFGFSSPKIIEQIPEKQKTIDVIKSVYEAGSLAFPFSKEEDEYGALKLRKIDLPYVEIDGEVVAGNIKNVDDLIAYLGSRCLQTKHLDLNSIGEKDDKSLKKISENFPEIKSLLLADKPGSYTILSADSIPSFKTMQNLTSLGIHFTPTSKDDLSFFESIPNLTYLNLRVWSFNSLERKNLELNPLKTLDHLTTLILNSYNISDFTPLGCLTNLKRLEISALDLNISFLSFNTNLTNLNVNQCSVGDFSPVESLVKLETLNIARNYSLRDVNFLTHLTNISSLNLAFCTQIEDHSGLERLTNLTKLDITGNYVRNIKFLSSLIKLRNLNFRWGHVWDRDYWGSLPALPAELEKLKLPHYFFYANISFLRSQTQLKSLDLSSCECPKDFTVLPLLTNLTKLNIKSGTTENLNFLKPLTKLTSLNLAKFHNVKDYSALKFLPDLKCLIVPYEIETKGR